MTRWILGDLVKRDRSLMEVWAFIGTYAWWALTRPDIWVAAVVVVAVQVGSSFAAGFIRGWLAVHPQQPHGVGPDAERL
jgi:hypothetical protein